MQRGGAAHQHARRRGSDRLRHRLQKVQRARRHAVEIALIDDDSILEDDETVRIRLIEQARQRCGSPLDGGDRQLVQVLLPARPLVPGPSPLHTSAVGRI